MDSLKEDKSAKGFFKGIGKGVTGLVIKPVAGTIDMISKTAEGIESGALNITICNENE